MASPGIDGPIVALTGTPGTGKTAIGETLRSLGHPVLALSRYVGDPRFDRGVDATHHDAVVLDEEALSEHLHAHLVEELGMETPFEGPVFIESHLAHELDFVDRIIVLRCSPKVLKTRLAGRAWPAAKVQANLEAEGLDLIVQEAAAWREAAALDGDDLPVGEVDTSCTDVLETARKVARLAVGAPTSLEIGTVDWSAEVLGWY